MTNFKTISEHEILRMASHVLLDRWLRELDREEEARKEGRKDTIATIKADKYRLQMDEIDARLRELEATA